METNESQDMLDRTLECIRDSGGVMHTYPKTGDKLLHKTCEVLHGQGWLIKQIVDDNHVIWRTGEYKA